MVMPESEPQKKEKNVRTELFEHLFPGQKWESLTDFNPLNVPIILTRAIIKDDIEKGKLVKAVEAKKGYVRRVEIPFPDKLCLVYELLEATITNESARLIRVKIMDLLRDGEKLGGVVVKPVSWLKKSAIEHGLASLIVSSFRGQQTLYEVKDILVIGVLSSDGKPAGLIYYLKGDRPVQHVKEEVPQLVPQFETAGVTI